ncbi:MAG: cupin domain-containing protein [Candidatus Njordarchaeia archaeon]
MEPIIKKIEDVEFEEVTAYNSKGARMQWLLSSDDGVENFAMRRFIIDKGGSIGEHSHWYEHEIFMLKGKCKITIDGKEYVASENMVLFVPPYAKHSYENIGDGPVEFLCMIPLKKPE